MSDLIHCVDSTGMQNENIRASIYLYLIIFYFPFCVFYNVYNMHGEICTQMKNFNDKGV